MTQTEIEIMKDAFYFLRDHAEPPSPGGAGSDAFWAKTATELNEMGVKYDNHPLALEIFPAIYTYIEKKQKLKGARSC